MSVVEGFVSVLSLCVRVKEKDVVKKCLYFYLMLVIQVAHISHSHISSQSCGFELQMLVF